MKRVTAVKTKKAPKVILCVRCKTSKPDHILAGAK